MTAADRPRFAELMGILGEMFNRTVSQVLALAYFQDLADFPMDRVERAIAQARRECEFFPKVAELRKYAMLSYDGLGRPAPRPTRALPPPAEPTIAPEAFSALIGHIGRRVPPTRAAEERPQYADVEPTPEERRAREAQREKLREQARALGVNGDDA